MNGWKNYQTWNVVLWIQSDPFLWGVAQESRSYAEFRQNLRELLHNCPNSELMYETGDGVAWNDSAIDQAELAKFWVDNDFGTGYLLSEGWTMYALTKRELTSLKRRLTNVKKSGDPKKVLAACHYASYVFETKGYPDCWSDWKRAAEDASLQLSLR